MTKRRVRRRFASGHSWPGVSLLRVRVAWCAAWSPGRAAWAAQPARAGRARVAAAAPPVGRMASVSVVMTRVTSPEVGAGGGTATTIFTTPWVNATGKLLAGMVSDCGNMSYVSAKPDEDLLIAGIALDGLWSSTDGGATWNPMGTWTQLEGDHQMRPTSARLRSEQHQAFLGVGNLLLR